MMSILFPQSKFGKQLASVLRKVIISIATLMAAKVPLLSDFADLIIQYAPQGAELLTALALAAFATLWGTEEKKKK